MKKKNDVVIVLFVVFIMVVAVGLIILLKSPTENTTGNIVAEQKLLESIKIGVVEPLSGPAATFGVPTKDGVVMAADEINSRGGINGHKLELIIEDSACDPKTGMNAVKKLVELDQVTYIVGDICSSVLSTTYPTTEANHVIVMGHGSSPLLSGAGQYLFRNWPSDNAQGKIIAEYIYDSGKRNIGIIAVDNDYGVGLADTFKQEFEKKGGTVSVYEKYPLTNKDFRSSLSKIKFSNEDGVYIIAQSTELVDILKQLRDLHINVSLYGADTFDISTIQEQAKDYLIDAKYAVPYINESDFSVTEFSDNYEQKYGQKPSFLLVSAIGYDAMNILAKAIGEVGYQDTGAVKEYLHSLKNYPGISGTTSFDTNGDCTKPFAIYSITDGQKTLVSVSG